MLEGMDKVSEALRTARLARGYSQRSAADRAGFSDATWRHLESGRTSPAAGVEADYNPSDRTLFAAALAVGIDPAPLFEMLGRAVPAAPPSTTPGALDALDEARVLLRQAITKVDSAAQMLEQDQQDLE